jgi:hypothetical protein
MPQFHGLDSGLVKNLYSSSANALLQVVWSERLALHVEVGDVKLKCGAQRVPHHLLLESRARHFPAQQLLYYVNLALRKFASSHSLRFLSAKIRIICEYRLKSHLRLSVSRKMLKRLY